MTARGKARKRALDVLYAAEMRDVPPQQVLAEGPPARGATGDVPVQNPYAATLVEGVVAHRDRIDALLAEHARGWALDRMPAVDRNVLRIAVFELLWSPDVPEAVVIDEAVEMARTLSTDESPGFVNGVLAQILARKHELAG